MEAGDCCDDFIITIIIYHGKILHKKKESAKIKIGESDAVSIVANAVVGEFTIQYVDLHKGLVSLVQTKVGDGSKKAVNVSYVKRGMAGVPTYLDWDGCQGVASILLQK